MDISSIASSFAKVDPLNGSDAGQLFSRTEFEEFLVALKEILDAAPSVKELDRAYATAIDVLRSRLLSGRMISCKMVQLRLCFTSSAAVQSRISLKLFLLQAMSIAALFPELPSRDFQAVDSTLESADALSIMSGSASTATSRPSTASPTRPFSGHASPKHHSSQALRAAVMQSYAVSAADCLHACHAHLTDPENFWKSINDACVWGAGNVVNAGVADAAQVRDVWSKARAGVGAGAPTRLAQHLQPHALRRLLPP